MRLIIAERISSHLTFVILKLSLSITALILLQRGLLMIYISRDTPLHSADLIYY